MNIDKLEAGRELDAKIAELMKSYWTVYDIDPVTHEEIPTNRLPSRIHYSRDEDMSGLVVDHLVAQGCRVVTHTLQDSGKTKSFCCVIRMKNGARHGSLVTELVDTRPMAICRAALMVREKWGK